MTPDLETALATLARVNGALVAMTAVPAALGLEPRAAARVVYRLSAAGMLDLWMTRPGEPACCLTPLAASRLGLKLESRGETPRWVPLGSDFPEPRVRQPRGTFHAINETDLARPNPDRPPRLDDFVDQRMLPAERSGLYAVAAEEPRSQAAFEKLSRRFDSPPLPTLLLGLGIAWPVRRAEGEPCPGCGGRPLGLTEACLVDGCDRSGNEHLLNPAPRAKRTTRYVVGRLAGGTGEAKGGKVKAAKKKRRAG